MITINLDPTDLVDFLDSLKPNVQKVLAEATAALAAATKTHIAEEANKKLHTRRDQFLEALDVMQMDANTWVVVLDAKAAWINDGTPERNMLEDLLKSPKAKRAKDGSQYLVVPFQHNNAKRTSTQNALLGTIKDALKDVGLTPNKIQLGADGKPKLGLVHQVDIKDSPLKSPRLNIGHGDMGQVVQGATGIPILKGIRIYQRMGKDRRGNDQVQRTIMTFRVASSKQKPPQWDRKAQEGVHLMEEGEKWAKEQLEKQYQDIASKILIQLK